jgi:hypothetical protein
MVFIMTNRRTVSITFQAGAVIIAPFCSHEHKMKNVYREGQDPAQEYGGVNVSGSFHLKLCPHGFTRADGDGLEDTQETGAANRHTPAHSVNIKKQFATNITERNFQTKSCHCLGNSFTPKS